MTPYIPVYSSPIAGDVFALRFIPNCLVPGMLAVGTAGAGKTLLPDVRVLPNTWTT